jgi:hypothetical protein
MGIISDFVVATEAEVRGYIAVGADAPLAHHAVGGVMSEHVGSLVGAAAEIADSDEVLESAFDLGDDGPWVYRFPEVTTRVLAGASPEVRQDLGRRWREIDAEAEHEYGELGGICADLIHPICELATRVAGDQHLFLVISL